MFLYVLKNDAMPGLYKVGYSSEPQTRATALSAVSGVPFPFAVVATANCGTLDKAMRAERIAHLMLEPYRVNYGREFFQMRHVNHAVHAIIISAFAINVYVMPGEVQQLAEVLSAWPIEDDAA